MFMLSLILTRLCEKIIGHLCFLLLLSLKLLLMDLTEFGNKNWKNAFIDSEVPDVCKDEPCILGVDEAGRGPVLGPMVYSVCYCPKSHEDELKALGVSDSKTLTEAKREEILKLIHDNSNYIGYNLEMISPMYISNCMYERNKISLNEVSQNSAATLIRRALDFGVNVTEVYVDTVGDPATYQARLQDIFPSINVTVSKKADSLFPIVSAASICAKVARDRALNAWKFPEEISVDSWGSGYPGDSVTKNFLINSLDKVFGFPGLVRFSWSTAEKILEDKGISVKWLHEAEDNKEENTPSVLQYFAKKRKINSDEETSVPKNVPPKRHFYFTDRCLKRISTL